MAGKQRGRRVPESEWPWPADGGRYLRDPETGALTRLPEDGGEPRPAAPPRDEAAGDAGETKTTEGDS